MNEQELKNQIEKLQREYMDLRTAISLALNLNNNTILAVSLVRAGVSAESILKCIIKRERINVKTRDPNIPIERADKIRDEEVQGLMLDQMIKLVEKKIPLRILTHLGTIRVWRNIGSHDQGENDISETVNFSTLQVVSLALSELVNWFVGEYLNQDTSGFNHNEELPEDNNEISTIEWQEEYWFAMRKGSIKALDEAKLNKIQHLHNIDSIEIESVKSKFNRKEELFLEIISEACEDNSIQIDELEAINHSRIGCCISAKETKEILEKFNWKEKFKCDPEKLNVDWMRDELVTYKLDLANGGNIALVNSIKIANLNSSYPTNIQLTKEHPTTKDEIQNIDNQVVVLSPHETPITNQTAVGFANEESSSTVGSKIPNLSSGDPVCCIQPFQTIIGGNNVLINSSVVFIVDSVDFNRNCITLKEFAITGKVNNTWLPISSFSSIVELPILDESILGTHDKIVCCKTEMDSSDLHSVLKEGCIYTVSGVKKNKKIVALEEFPQHNISDKKKWFSFKYFRVLDIMPKPLDDSSTKPLQALSTQTLDAEIEIMLATINGMLKSFRGDKKKWALQYNGHELFSIASGVLNGRIKSSELKDAITSFVSKKNR
jgi:hypothetical protein